MTSLYYTEGAIENLHQFLNATAGSPIVLMETQDIPEGCKDFEGNTDEG